MLLGKRVRKRRRKKKRAESPQPINKQQPQTLSVKIVEQNQCQSQTAEYPKIEIIPATSDLQVNELEWIKKNEALLIAELETRRQEGLPVQVVVKVEKITPSKPEYCQIIPDCCHLEVIKEETSASDEDRKRENRQCLEENQKSNSFRETSADSWNSMDNDNNNICEFDNILEVNSNDVMKSEHHLERLESPSLVRDSEILRFADVISSENESVIELEQLKPFNDVTINVKNVESDKHRGPETLNILNNNLNCEKHMNVYNVDYNNINKNQEQKKYNKNETTNNNINKNFIYKQNQLKITNTAAHSEKFNELFSQEDVNHKKNLNSIYFEDKHVKNEEVFNAKSQFNNCSTLTNLKYNKNTIENNEYIKNEHYLKNVEVPHLDNTEHEESSDESTIKQYQTFNYEYKKRNKNKVSINDKLKQIAVFLQGDTTDDYDDLQILQKTPRCVSSSDADVDTDWVSFTLSDGESSKSLCLSPSQLKSGCAPSTASETSEIIDLHNKFINRTRSPNLSPHRDTPPVEILSYSESSSASPSKLYYTTEVFDEACRMCGTSDKPLSDAECLVSLRKYRETRSRLLDVIQKEQRLNRSVIDRPSSMSTFIDTLSVPDNHTRERMYTEYMEKVRERENRLQNKIIRITKAGRPLSSGTLQALNDIDAEFLIKARERLEKLGVESGVDADGLRSDEYYPKHLVDIVPAEEVCIEEVQMINGELIGLTVYLRFLCFISFY